MELHKKILLLFLILILSQIQIKAQSLEYIVKASYIEKFARFTQWPEATITDTFVIAVIGQSPIESHLITLAKKYSIKKKVVTIIHISNINYLKKCNLLFIAPSEANQLNQILLTIQDKPILTVSEKNGFCQKGTHINFYFSPEGAIYFEINPEKIKQSGLKVDMYMLEFGKIITQNK